jgi:hypothetical protein
MQKIGEKFIQNPPGNKEKQCLTFSYWRFFLRPTVDKVQLKQCFGGGVVSKLCFSWYFGKPNSSRVLVVSKLSFWPGQYGVDLDLSSSRRKVCWRHRTRLLVFSMLQLHIYFADIKYFCVSAAGRFFSGKYKDFWHPDPSHWWCPADPPPGP